MAIITKMGIRRMRATVILLAVVMPAAPLKVCRCFLQRYFLGTIPRMGLFSSFKLKQTTPSSRPRPSDAEPLRRADLTAVPAGAGWHAVSVRGEKETGLWPSFAVDFLAACSEFRPLPEHLHEYARYHSIESGADAGDRPLGRSNG